MKRIMENALAHIEWEKSLTLYDSRTKKDIPTNQARNPRSLETALKISENQYRYGIEHELLYPSLEEYKMRRYKRILKKLFKWAPGIRDKKNLLR